MEKVRESFTCPLFSPVVEPVYQARVSMMKKYGEVAAIEAMLDRPPELKEPEKERG